MKKLFKTIAAIALTAVMCAGCSSNVKPNEVFSAADLEGKVIGVQQGTTGDTFVSSEENGVNAKEVSKFKKGTEAITALKQGKVDAVVIDNEPALEFVADNDDLMILDEKLAVEEYAIAVNKDRPELTAAINTALDELEADGTLGELKAFWIEETGGKGYVSPEGIAYPNGTLTMATNATFPPYEFKREGEIVGFDVDMMRAVCDKLGYELKISDMDFNSIIAAVKSGKADVGVAGISVTEDRKANIDFTRSYFDSAAQVIIVRKK